MYFSDPHSGLPINGAPSLLSWEISDDGLVYTFTIRDDAYWSDGVPISSHGVKFTYESVISDLVPTTRTSWMDNVEAINIVDDRTFEFVYRELDCNPWPRLTIRPLPSSPLFSRLHRLHRQSLQPVPDRERRPLHPRRMGAR